MSVSTSKSNRKTVALAHYVDDVCGEVWADSLETQRQDIGVEIGAGKELRNS